MEGVWFSGSVWDSAGSIPRVSKEIAVTGRTIALCIWISSQGSGDCILPHWLIYYLCVSHLVRVSPTQLEWATLPLYWSVSVMATDSSYWWQLVLTRLVLSCFHPLFLSFSLHIHVSPYLRSPSLPLLFPPLFSFPLSSLSLSLFPLPIPPRILSLPPLYCQWQTLADSLILGFSSVPILSLSEF